MAKYVLTVSTEVVGLGSSGHIVKVEHEFDDIKDLAVAVYREVWSGTWAALPLRRLNGYQVEVVNLRADSCTGRPLDVETLFYYGRTLDVDNRAIGMWRRFAKWNGEGPVPGVHKRRGGHRYYRRLHTTPERRDAINFVEEGEPPVRAKRNACNIPNTFDDYFHTRERNWKSQGKKRKQYL